MKIIKISLLVMVFMFTFAFTISSFAMETDYNIYHLKGTGTISGTKISGEFTVTNTQGLSSTLSCSLYGTGYNSVGAGVGTYSGSNSANNKSSVKATGSGTCYITPSYLINHYVFSGMTWTD